MDENYAIIRDYENILAGIDKDFPVMYFSECRYQKDAMVLLRYVFEELLHWSPQDVRDYLTLPLIHQLRLTRVYHALPFPKELDPKKDVWYVAVFVYPDLIHYNRSLVSLHQYELVYLGKRPRLPKDFFHEFEGEITASLCLNWIIARKLATLDIRELYAFFGNRKKARRFLRKWWLLGPCEDFFDSPLEFFHLSIPQEQQNNLLYDYEIFKQSYNQAKEIVLHANHNKK